jgi:hypothetical protein
MPKTKSAEWQSACTSLAYSLQENLSRTVKGDDSMLRQLGYTKGSGFKLDAEAVRTIQEAQQRIIDAIEEGMVLAPRTRQNRDPWKCDQAYRKFRAVMLMQAPYPDDETFRRAARAQLFRNGPGVSG